MVLMMKQHASRWTIQGGSERFYWNNIPEIIFEKDPDEAYGQIVYWWKNLFMLPSGAAGKRFINELNRILNLWTDKSSFKNVALEKIHVLSGLLL